MTHTNQTVNTIGSAVRFEFAAIGDSYLVASGVTVRSTDTVAIYSAYGDNVVQVDGLVESTNTYAVYMRGAGSTVAIGSRGTLSSASGSSGGAVLYALDGTSTITNLGKIIGETTIGILTRSGGNDIINSGSVQGASGVFMGLYDTGGDSLENFGRISAGSFDDDARDYRFNNGVYGEGTDTRVVNHAKGIISAISSEGAGVAMAADAEVNNQGRISSALWYGVDFFNMAAGESGRLENSGQISGGEGAFRGNESGDFVINTGIMKGNIVFNAGDDVLNGAKGSVVGDVSGGDGNDILQTGRGNQAIDGGANDDIIDGGKGADELLGGTGSDRFVFASGYGRDEIGDFTSGTDLIDISDWKAIKNFDDMLRHARDKSGDVWIVAGHDILIIDNATKSALAEADFLI